MVLPRIWLAGGVRDLLLGREPKDFDIATNARPEQVRKLFRNCRLIGRRFRLAHVHFGYEIIEVATFRSSEVGNHDEQRHAHNGQILRDNVYGSLDEDVWRRDFTVNALYYNIADFSVVDFTNGIEDIKHGVIRIIGDAEQRYREDPVRMLRAVRFASKLGFRLETTTGQAIHELNHLLQNVSPARLFDEVIKLFHHGMAFMTFKLLRQYQLLNWLFPQLEQLLAVEDEASSTCQFINQALQNTDRRIVEGKPVIPAFLLAVFLWKPMQAKAAKLQQQHAMKAFPALELASTQVISQQLRHTSIPKRIINTIREIWDLQYRLNYRHGKKAFLQLNHPRFRAAYDFLLIRASAGENVQELADWWRDFSHGGDQQRHHLVDQLKRRQKSTRQRRSKNVSHRTSGSSNTES